MKFINTYSITSLFHHTVLLFAFRYLLDLLLFDCLLFLFAYLCSFVNDHALSCLHVHVQCIHLLRTYAYMYILYLVIIIIIVCFIAYLVVFLFTCYVHVFFPRLFPCLLACVHISAWVHFVCNRVCFLISFAPFYCRYISWFI